MNGPSPHAQLDYIRCPAGHWGRSSDLNRYVSMRCTKEMGHMGPCQLEDQLAHLRIERTGLLRGKPTP